jgi:hypothetical protein
MSRIYEEQITYAETVKEFPTGSGYTTVHEVAAVPEGIFPPE